MTIFFLLALIIGLRISMQKCVFINPIYFKDWSPPPLFIWRNREGKREKIKSSLSICSTRKWIQNPMCASPVLCTPPRQQDFVVVDVVTTTSLTPKTVNTQGTVKYQKPFMTWVNEWRKLGILQRPGSQIPWCYSLWITCTFYN